MSRVECAWASYPEHGVANHWHVELGLLAEWLAAVAATPPVGMQSVTRAIPRV
jgi:hypothetical protein